MRKKELPLTGKPSVIVFGQLAGTRSAASSPQGPLTRPFVFVSQIDFVCRKDAHLTHFVGNPEKPNVRFSTELKGHAAPIEKVAFNPVKDAELCSVSSDGVVKFWDVRTKNCVNEVKGLGDAFTLAWHPDGETLVVGNKVRDHPRRLRRTVPGEIQYR